MSKRKETLLIVRNESTDIYKVRALMRIKHIELYPRPDYGYTIFVTDEERMELQKKYDFIACIKMEV